MPYVRRGSAYRRGVGDTGSDTLLALENAPVNAVLPFASACNWWDVACWTGLDTVLSGQVPQNPNASGPQATLPNVPAPVLAVGSTSPGTPVGYVNTAPTGAIPGNTTGATETSPYAVSYPTAQTPCDWTQASWIDPTTWCTVNWAMAGVLAFGVFMALRGGR